MIFGFLLGVLCGVGFVGVAWLRDLKEWSHIEDSRLFWRSQYFALRQAWHDATDQRH